MYHHVDVDVAYIYPAHTLSLIFVIFFLFFFHYNDDKNRHPTAWCTGANESLFFFLFLHHRRCCCFNIKQRNQQNSIEIKGIHCFRRKIMDFLCMKKKVLVFFFVVGSDLYTKEREREMFNKCRRATTDEN